MAYYSLRCHVSRCRRFHLITVSLNVKVNRYQSCHSKKEDKDQESIQSSTTADPGYQWESDNFSIRHHKRESRGQPLPSDHKASMNIRAQKHNKNKTEAS